MIKQWRCTSILVTEIYNVACMQPTLFPIVDKGWRPFSYTRKEKITSSCRLFSNSDSKPMTHDIHNPANQFNFIPINVHKIGKIWQQRVGNISKMTVFRHIPNTKERVENIQQGQDNYITTDRAVFN